MFLLDLAVLTWDCWGSQARIFTIDFFLSSFLCSSYEPEITQRWKLIFCNYLVLMTLDLLFPVSKTIAVAPFLVNYSGALFRQYPGEINLLFEDFFVILTT